MALIEDFEERYVLGVPAMDRNHREFVDLVNRMAEASNATFAYLFSEMVQHTHAHFAAEEVMMRETAFSASDEHRDEHRRVLGELDWFCSRLQQGHISLARAYVVDQIPGWFKEHALTMDTALAAHLVAARPARAGGVS
ncbi:hemerythrin family protein [Thiorhodococcus mannitoliphagus]|uniref:Hemerythrin family protein n=1 Tax=Thiorhodococcus mannitoliphagus TaxID=329406 RepID=A0A6P1DVC7_9GAMM|nr:hemerythrin family protein [Thiorhodococcus mannitoliphagus]NEX22297.1 hemerythrin family protein [Thiorhodococcus mannitoliphagus]